MTKNYTALQTAASKIILTALVCFLVTGISFSQGSFPVCTKGNNNVYLPHCTSNDLSVVNAYLTSTSCSCTSGSTTTATLNMKLANKTGSFRTSFAFFANLEQRNASGGLVSTTYLTRCASGVQAKDTSEITFNDPITFLCGTSLTLTNVYLAWTDASDNKQCPLAFCDIAPKCGTPQDITITPLLSGTATSTLACKNTSDGTLTISAVGGKTPYQYKVGAGSYTSTAIFTALGKGTYTCTIKDNTGCEYTFTQAVNDKLCCTNPAQPTVVLTPPPLCGGAGTYTLTITNAQVGATYYLIQAAGGLTTQTATASTSTVTFGGLVVTKGFTVHGEDTPDCVGTSTTCSDVSKITVNAPSISGPASLANPTNNVVERIVVPDGSMTVKAYPNPYNDNIRFVVTAYENGRGSLVLYNLLGQKFRVVYDGEIREGNQIFEAYIPPQQRTNLVYVLRMKNKQISGKMISLNGK